MWRKIHWLRTVPDEKKEKKKRESFKKAVCQIFLLIIFNRHGIRRNAEQSTADRRETSGVPWGSIWWPLLFFIFINDIELGIECSLSKFAVATKLTGVIHTPEGDNTNQRNLDKLKKHLHRNLMRFNKTSFLSHAANGTFYDCSLQYLPFLCREKYFIHLGVLFHAYMLSQCTHLHRIKG